MSKTVWMFPTPGAHLPGTLGALVDGNATMQSTLDSVDRIAERYDWDPVTPGLLRPDSDACSGPEHLWLGFYVTSLVVADILTAHGVACDALVGHSAGEVSALVVAGSLTAEDGARILCERTKAVEAEGSSAPSGGMVALAAPMRRVAHLCGAVDQGSLVVAVDNGPGQVVASGETGALALLEKAADVLGIQATWLAIPDSYHNPRLGKAARRMADAIRDVPRKAPLIPVYSPQLGRYVRNADDVLALLEGMLLLPVQFRPALNTLYDDGADTFIECGAKQVLSDIVPECLPKAARAVPGLTGRAQAGSAQQLVETVTTKPVHGPQPRPAAKQPAPTAPAPPERDVAEPLTPAPPPPEASHNGSADGLPAESVLRDEIRAVYAEILQYPADVIEDDVALEAELGVSSLKQTQAFVRLLDKFELSTPSSDVRIFDYRTVADISTLLRQLADAR